MPLVATTTIASRSTPGATSADTARRWLEGGTRMTTSALAATWRASTDARLVGRIRMPGGDLLGHLGLVRPHRHRVLEPRQVAGERGAPRSGADDSNSRHGLLPSRPEPPHHLPLPGVDR